VFFDFAGCTASESEACWSCENTAAWHEVIMMYLSTSSEHLEDMDFVLGVMIRESTNPRTTEGLEILRDSIALEQSAIVAVTEILNELSQ